MALQLFYDEDNKFRMFVILFAKQQQQQQNPLHRAPLTFVLPKRRILCYISYIARIIVLVERRNTLISH